MRLGDMDRIDLAQNSVMADACERGNKLSGFIKCR
jgi:hypothetical protein